MGKRFVSNACLCPYYKAQNRNEVICQGPRAGTSLHLAFSSPAERKDYQKVTCHKMDYDEKCLIARVHEASYE